MRAGVDRDLVEAPAVAAVVAVGGLVMAAQQVAIDVAILGGAGARQDRAGGIAHRDRAEVPAGQRAVVAERELPRLVLALGQAAAGPRGRAPDPRPGRRRGEREGWRRWTLVERRPGELRAAAVPRQRERVVAIAGGGEVARATAQAAIARRRRDVVADLVDHRAARGGVDRELDRRRQAVARGLGAGERHAVGGGEDHGALVATDQLGPVGAAVEGPALALVALDAVDDLAVVPVPGADEAVEREQIGDREVVARRRGTGREADRDQRRARGDHGAPTSDRAQGRRGGRRDHGAPTSVESPPCQASTTAPACKK